VFATQPSDKGIHGPNLLFVDVLQAFTQRLQIAKRIRSRGNHSAQYA